MPIEQCTSHDLVRAFHLAKKLRKFFDREYGGNLPGFCSITSRILYRLLRRRSIPCSLAEVFEHSFILMRNNRIFVLDITATQFKTTEKKDFPGVTMRPVESDSLWKNYTLTKAGNYRVDDEARFLKWCLNK